MMKRMNLTSCAIATALLAFTGPNNATAADRHVPADYATIQTAVNAAASGDTIHIAPGIYREQTWITEKNLTLVGQPGTILRAFPGMQPGLPGVVDWGCIIFISDSGNVIIRNLTFEGDQLADQNDVGIRGVNFDVSGGAVENCRFTGFREATPGSKFGKAIHFFNALPGAALLQARVINTVIEDSYSGLAIHGNPEATSYDVGVFDNTIIGVGLKGSELRHFGTGACQLCTKQGNLNAESQRFPRRDAEKAVKRQEFIAAKVAEDSKGS